MCNNYRESNQEKKQSTDIKKKAKHIKSNTFQEAKKIGLTKRFFKESKFFYISLKNSVTLGLRDSEILAFFLSSIFVYEPILINIFMNANTMKTQNFIK